MKNQTITQNHNLPSSRWLILFATLLTMTLSSCEVGDNPLPGPYLSSPVDQQFIIDGGVLMINAPCPGAYPEVLASAFPQDAQALF